MPPSRRSADDARATDAGRPTRADAQRNRVRVMEAAEAVFAAKGTSASTEEVARAAGVGIGTVFRHFPTKETLLEAVFVHHIEKLLDYTNSLTGADDAGSAFIVFFTHVVEQAATKNAVADALADAGVNVDDTTSRIKQDYRRALDTLLSRAQRAGAVRTDIDVPALIALLIGTSRMAEHGDSDLRARTLAVVLDGLRPPAEARPPL